jgi:protein-tyrosine-phosphatase
MIDFPGAVLFSCTMNSIRSPMAEGIFRYFHGRHTYVQSVGVREREVDGFAIATMDEIGIDISGHLPNTFEKLDDSSFDLVISLSPEAQHKAVEMTRTMACEVEFWHTFDPSFVEGSRDERLEAFRKVRDELMSRILKRFPVRSSASL